MEQGAENEHPPIDDTARSTMIDPSETVTGFAIMLGIVGAVLGLAAGIYVQAASGVLPALLNAFIAVLAGGSAGAVTGGTLGAVLGVVRGRRAPKAIEQP